MVDDDDDDEDDDDDGRLCRTQINKIIVVIRNLRMSTFVLIQ